VNWDAIGALGEIIGAIAVVASLIYLAGQIRTQNREARVSAMHDISVGFRDAINNFASEEVCAIFIKANKDYDSLSDVEAQMLIVLMGQFFRAFEEAYIQYDEGRLDQRSWNAITKYYLKIISAPAMQTGWQLRRGFLDESFVEFVDSHQEQETYTFRG